jgi:hypothetical protein
MALTHLSYSAIVTYLRNPFEFRKRYILKINDERVSPAMLVGKAVHKAIEMLYKGQSLATAQDAGFALIEAAQGNVDYGKNGSIEKIREDFLQTLEHFMQERPTYTGEIDAELIMQTPVRGLKLPVKAVADLVVRNESGIVLVDWKKVQGLLSPEDPTPPEYEIQAFTNYLATKGTFGTYPVRMDFVQIKTSKNKNGEPQVVLRSIDFQTPEWAARVKQLKRLTNAIVRDVSRKTKLYMLNPSDMFNDGTEWEEFLATV